MAFTIQPATKLDAIPVFCLSGEAFSGKTYSALRLARGLVGLEGTICLICSEQGRGGAYVDLIENGYDLLKLTEPYSPTRYIEAIQQAEKLYDVVIVDSASHEWEGIGGVLDMVSTIEADLLSRNKKVGINIWARPKQDHNKFLQKLLTSQAKIIVTCRGKFKNRLKGQTMVRDENLSMIQSEDFSFEMNVILEIGQDHKLTMKKCDQPELQAVFKNGSLVSEAMGQEVAQWSKGSANTKEHPNALSQARKQAYQGKETFIDHVESLSDSEKAVLKPYKPQLTETMNTAEGFIQQIEQASTTDALNAVWNSMNDDYRTELMDRFNKAVSNLS